MDKVQEWACGALFIFKKKERSTVACRNGVAWMLLLPTN
jgi:hypothetical protein